MPNSNKKRNVLIAILCVTVLLLAGGYAAFQTALDIDGTANITSKWEVKITNILSKNIIGTASNNEEPTFTGTSATFKTNLESPGDSIEYDITVTNSGTLDAKLDNITLTDTSNPAIKFTTRGLKKGDIIKKGTTGIMNVKVEYDNNVTSEPVNKESELTVALDYSQSINNNS